MGAPTPTPSTAALRRVSITRYVSPLREGGSLPAIVEVDGGDLVVAKWRGAGQGAAVLVAEVIAGALARALGLRVPELVVATLGEDIARGEPHQEISDLLRASVGDNLGMGYLSGALGYDPAAASAAVDGALAARIVVFDAFVMNVDRTARNPNLLLWRSALWLIDHGAALYWHHGWDGTMDRPERPFPLVRDHVLLRSATDLAKAGAALVAALDDRVLQAAVDAVPDVWIEADDVAARRGAYVEFLRRRRDGAAGFIEEAVRVRGV